MIMVLVESLLTLDLGNSNLKATLFKGEQEEKFTLQSEKVQEELQGFLAQIAEQHKIDQVIFCSVLPRLNQKLKDAVKEIIQTQALEVDQALLEKIGMTTETEGAGNDRIATVYGLWLQYKKGLIIADLGTAITLDVISESGEFLGGSISPGLKLSSQALENHAKQLFSIPLEPIKEIIGKNSTSAMQSGIILGNAIMTKFLAEKFSSSCNCNFHQIVTGGSALLIHPYLGEGWEIKLNATAVALKNIYKALSQSTLSEKNHG